MVQRHLHGPEPAIAIFGRSGDVVGVARKAIAQNLGIDFCAARLGVLVFLEHDHTRALAHDKPVAIRVIGPAGGPGIVRALGAERLAGVEPRDADLADRRLGPAGDHHVGIAEHDQAAGVPDGVGAGRTGRHNRVVRPLEAIADAHLARNQVDQCAGDEERRHAPRALVADDQRGFLDRAQPADARPDHNPGAHPALLVLGHPVRVAHRLIGGGNAVEDEIIDLAALFREHVGIGVERAVRAVAIGHLAGILRGHVGRVEPGDRTGTGLTVKDAAPGFLDPIGQGRDQSKARYDDTTHDTALSS